MNERRTQRLGPPGRRRRAWTPKRGPLPWRVAGVVAAVLACGGGGFLSASANAADLPDEPAADDRPGVEASLVSIPLPLTGKDDQLLKGTLQRAVDRLTSGRNDEAGAGRPILVLEFSTDPRAAQPDGRGSEFERALALARFLASDAMAPVKTVAFLPNSVKGHALLPVIACEEIAMAPDAEIGEAAADEAPDRPIEPFIAAPYRDLAEARRTVPAALAVGWIDRRAEVYRVESEDQIDLVLADELPELEKNRTIVDSELLIPAGVLGLQNGRLGRELGFVKYLAADRRNLARVLRVPAALLEESPAAAGEWNPVVIDIQGAITPKVVSRVEKLIGDEIKKQNVNWIGLRIDSSGGDLESCLRLATAIAELDAREVRTVAYVPAEAAGGAGLVALACDQLVMHPGAHVGGGYKSPQRPAPAPVPDDEDRRRVRMPEPPPEEAPEAPPEKPAPGGLDHRLDQQFDRDQIDAAVSTIRTALAEKSEHPASLLEAIVDPDLRVFRYTHQQTADVRLMGEQEAATQPDADKWTAGAEVTRPGESLRLDAETAQQLGVAWRVVDTFDALRRLYSFGEPPRVAKPNWALELVETLGSKQFAMLLLMVGFMGVYIELNMPGVGVGGFIAAVAFVLFFWSRFTAQTADWLEVLLFITGIVCILIEVLVLPGMGVFGFGGAALVLASLVLASQTFVIPKTASQLEELRGSLTTVAGAFAGMIVVGVVLRRYLPHTPMFRRMQLAPAEGADLIEQEHRESLADYAYLVGKTGVATTNLMPSGRAEIDGELVDVIADGDIIDRGTRIEVTSARANRVMVRAVRG